MGQHLPVPFGDRFRHSEPETEIALMICMYGRKEKSRFIKILAGWYGWRRFLSGKDDIPFCTQDQHSAGSP